MAVGEKGCFLSADHSTCGQASVNLAGISKPHLSTRVRIDAKIRHTLRMRAARVGGRQDTMLIDAFMFFQEFEILKLRLAVLSPLVDKFVIVEADATHSGRRRDYIFPAYCERHLSKYAAQILYHPISIDLSKFHTDWRPEIFDLSTDHWKLENLQRNAIDDACRPFAEEDLLMISDVDEIPQREAVEYVLRHEARVIEGPLAFQQFFFYYSLRRLRREDWRGTVVTTVGRSRKLSAQWHRNGVRTFPYLAKSGWHLSYFGGTARIQAKLESFAHQ